VRRIRHLKPETHTQPNTMNTQSEIEMIPACAQEVLAKREREEKYATLRRLKKSVARRRAIENAQEFIDYEVQAEDDESAEIPQIDPETGFTSGETTFWKIAQNRVQKLCASPSFLEGCAKYDAEWIHQMFENVHHSFYWFKRCDNYYMWACMVYKLFTGKSSSLFLIEKWNSIFGIKPEDSEVQSSFGDAVKILRTSFNTIESLSENPMVKKFKKLFTFLLVQGYLEHFGFKVTDEEYSRLEQHALRAAFRGKRGLWMAAFDVVLFMAEKSYEFYETRDVSVFIHNTSEYADWHKEVDRLVGLADFIGNLEAHGTTYFTYVANLDDAIEKGESYLKYTKARGAVESTYMMKKVAALRTIKLTQITRCAAQEERQAPFGVLVTGHSSVAKSSFCKMLYYYFGHYRGLDTDSRYIYRRNVSDQYWSNFDTSKWCIQLDDIAYLLPSKTTQIDETLSELLNIANNVPYVPNQADLKDKGNTPVKCQLLIATSNAEHLNAHEYFYCPLAVQRRLPFVVEVTPKKEYLQENGHFIDPSKLTVEPGKYPDFWIIKVKKIVPYMEGKQERCKLEESPQTTYTSVIDFLSDYGSSIKQHFKNQQGSLGSDVNMSKISVCTTCAKPSYACTCPKVQSDEQTQEQESTTADERSVPNNWVPEVKPSWTTRCAKTCLNWYVGCTMWWLELSWSMWFLRLMMKYWVLRIVIYRALSWCIPECAQCVLFGILNGVNTMPARWRALSSRTRLVVSVVSVAAVSAGAYYGARHFISKASKSAKEAVKVEEFQLDTTTDSEYEYEAEDLPTQGNKFNTTEEQLKKEVTQNVWYNATLETSRFDLPVPSTSLVGKNPSEVRDMFARNIVRLSCRTREGPSIRVRQTCGVFVSGGYLLAPAHLYRHMEDECDLEIISAPIADGVSSNMHIRVKKGEIKFDRLKDLSMLRVIARPPEKNILKFWAEKEFTVTRMCEVRRTPEGNVDIAEVFGVDLLPACPVPDLGLILPVYQGTSDRDTVNGDCGSLTFAMIPLGVAIVGIHLLGRDRACGVLQVMKSDVEALCAAVDADEMIPFNVEGGGAPMLSVQDRQVHVGALNVRSMSRYIAQGTMRVYGTLDLPEPRYKSRVIPTLLSEEMQEHFGVEIDHGKPAMRGYAPWRNNLVKMVEPENIFDRVAFQECAEAFVDDIVAELPAGWEKELVVLSNKAAVNGVPSVKFIDGMNRNSSMGFPWNTTKKNYLVPDPCDAYPDGVNLPDEIWERVAEIEKCYGEGRRAYPVFSAHLKDCATPFAKIEKKKTRVFTGQPVDHCIVTRKYLLSFVRLVQKNKFVFEAGPGTVTQSPEWAAIREWLISFGPDRLAAGDYGSYDKKMAAAILLYAFSVIAKLHEIAGYDAKECRVIMCIGYDIAFSICNFRGDLVEFFGTNPSGHALTVIINSFVNSLYMRYAYYMSNPEKEARTFRKNVHLFTYGDDNAMGISTKCAWFHHTAIQNVMASIGVEYTMADKQSESIPYIHIDDVSFLKRKWRWDEEVKAWLCPLELASLHKTLTVWLPSQTIDSSAQMVEVITCVNNELFFHGRKKFEEHHGFFRMIFDRFPFNCIEKTKQLLTFDELIERYQSQNIPPGFESLEADDKDLAVPSPEN